MGLGSKIKHAIHGDQKDRRATVRSTAKAPGAYPSEETFGISGPNDSFITDNTSKPIGTTGTGLFVQCLIVLFAACVLICESGAKDSLEHSASQRNKIHKNIHEDNYDTLGDESSPQSATSQRSWDSGVGGIGKAKDHQSTGGYWGDMGHITSTRNKTSTPKDVSDPSYYQYNGVTETGIQNPQGSHANRLSQQGRAVHDPLTSSSKRVPTASDDGYNEDYLPEHNMTSSRNDYNSRSLNGKGLNGHGLNGHGLNGSGLNGRGTASKGMTDDYVGQYDNEEPHSSRGNHTYSNNHAAGVPKSSMLVPEPATTQHNAAPRVAGISSPSTSERSAAQSPPSGVGANMPSASRGKNHFGPGHDGAKVLHQCEHCGNDNDISRYFRNDVVYRLGS